MALVFGLEEASAAGFTEANISCPLGHLASGIFNGQHTWPVDNVLEANLTESIGRMKRWLIESPEALQTGTEE